MKTLIVSDVPFGYGSNQVQYLRNSLLEIGHDAHMTCPSYDSRPVISDARVETIITKSPAFTLQGHKEYLKTVRQKIYELKFEHIVIVNPKNIFLAKHLRKEHLVTYYGLENLENQYYGYSFIKRLFKKFNFAIFPESNRLERDERYFPTSTDFFLVYNTVPKSKVQKRKVRKQRDFIYAGNLSPTHVDTATIVELSKDGKVEIYGDLIEAEQSNLLEVYGGLLNSESVMDEVMRSRFSLIAWKPNNFSQINASPNKMYQAISLGVPIISYPYPQAREIVERYGIGFLAENFESKSLRDAGRRAMKLELQDYESMSDRALSAFDKDLNWECQIAPYISKILGDKS